MLALTRKTDYAIVALAAMASDGQSAAASAHELSDELHLPLPALRNILKALAQHNLLDSVKGKNGGYRLARTADQITLAEIVEAIEGPVRLALCCSTGSNGEETHNCFLEDSCRIKGSVRKVHRNLVGYLGQVTLKQIANDDVPEVVPLITTKLEVGRTSAL